ncbi:MAG: hypothetical protein WAU49_18060 [Steroidobacteraceae bacterium]
MSDISSHFAGRTMVSLAAAAALFALLLQAPAATASNLFKNSNVPRLPPIPPELAKKFFTPLPGTTTEYRRELAALHIKALRQNRDARDPDAPNAANYDPALANPYPRPSQVLREEGGAWAKTPAAWWAERRPEIVAAAEEALYGAIPADVPSVTWRVVGTEKGVVDGVAATTTHLVGHVDNSADPAITVDIGLTEVLPDSAQGRVPVIIEFGMGNFKLPKHMGPEVAPLPGIPPAPVYHGPESRYFLLHTGWGYANLDATSVQADNGAGLGAGIIGLTNRGKPRSLGQWGSLRAWGWGASRALDYLQTDPRVAPDEIGITGDSRFGKAAVATMAFDQRFAIALFGSSGAAGAKLIRRNYGETLEDVAYSNEYHWMAGNFLKYAADPLTANDLPVDGDAVLALCAPRPIFISVGNPAAGDAWIDPVGEFMAAVGAGPVYQLLGKKPLQTDRFPPMLTTLIAGDIGFRQHQFGHMAAQGPDWPAFIQFARKYLHTENR